MTMMRCKQCGHAPDEYDPRTEDELPTTLDGRDIGASWTVRSTHRQYTWTGNPLHHRALLPLVIN